MIIITWNSLKTVGMLDSVAKLVKISSCKKTNFILSGSYIMYGKQIIRESTTIWRYFNIQSKAKCSTVEIYPKTVHQKKCIIFHVFKLNYHIEDLKNYPTIII